MQRIFVFWMMRMILFLATVLMSCSATAQPKIIWTDNFNVDVSFTKNWEYPEGVYVNRHGQLSCDGLCPEGTDAMKDAEGRLITDSLMAFYVLVDTTHIYQTISCEARAYEFSGATETTCTAINNKVKVQTLGSVSTHSVLSIVVTTDYPNPGSIEAEILYNSILPIPKANYKCIDGVIEISKPDFSANLLKARFDLVFESAPDDPEPLTWKGVICAPMIPQLER